MGVSMKDFLAIFYNIIFHNDDILLKIKNEVSFEKAVLVSFFMFTFLAFLNFKEEVNTNFLYDFLPHFIVFAFWGVVRWVTLGWILELVSKINNKDGHLKEFLTLSAFSLLPLLFLAPLQLFKVNGGILYFFAAIMEAYIFIRVFCLYFKSAQIAYNLSLKQTLILFCLPFIMFFVVVSWTIGFFEKLIYIFSV